jgi:hypothetical protein
MYVCRREGKGNVKCQLRRERKAREGVLVVVFRLFVVVTTFCSCETFPLSPTLQNESRPFAFLGESESE